MSLDIVKIRLVIFVQIKTNVVLLNRYLTCLQSAAIRFRLLVETVRLIVIPAKRRLLFPKIDERERDVG